MRQTIGSFCKNERSDVNGPIFDYTKYRDRIQQDLAHKCYEKVISEYKMASLNNIRPTIVKEGLIEDQINDPAKQIDQKQVFADASIGEDHLMRDDQLARNADDKAQKQKDLRFMIDQAPIDQIVSLDSMNLPKALMSIENCIHKGRKHYAKGMCKYCYSLNGRKIFAHKCVHKDKKCYARGMCRNCYTNLKRLESRTKIKMYEQLQKKIDDGELIQKTIYPKQRNSKSTEKD